MLEMRAFKHGDLDNMAIQKEQIHEIESACQRQDISFTLADDEKVIGVFSVLKVYSGRGVVSSFISKDAGSYMLEMIRLLRKLIAEGMYKCKIDRLEMSVLKGFEHGDRFAKMLGFEYEGTMRNYYKGKDYKLYARIRK